jgi:hypothetical protein
MNISLERVFVIDFRSQRFGFVLLEERGTLLDWGVCGYRTSVPKALRRKIAHVADQFAPFLIVSRRDVNGAPARRALTNLYLDVLKCEAQRHACPLRLISASSVHEHFYNQGRRNKHEVSQVVAGYFPELAWRLPRKRKPWQSEPAIQVLFDAAALALFHFEQSSTVEAITVD